MRHSIAESIATMYQCMIAIRMMRDFNALNDEQLHLAIAELYDAAFVANTVLTAIIAHSEIVIASDTINKQFHAIAEFRKELVRHDVQDADRSNKKKI